VRRAFNSDGHASLMLPTQHTVNASYGSCRHRHLLPGPAWINKPQEVVPTQ
jgi:hypothetical protein